MTTITHETTIGATGGKANSKGKMIPLAGKLQISNAKLIPAIGRKAKVSIEYDEILPEDMTHGTTYAGDNTPPIDAPTQPVEPEKANPKEIIGVQ